MGNASANPRDGITFPMVRAAILALPLILSACAGGGGTSSSATALTSASPVANPCDVNVEFGELPAGATCSYDIDASESTPMRVAYTIPATGWSAFIGTFKDVEDGGGHQRVNVLFAQVDNLTVDACKEQVPANPPIGPTVADLAAALSELPPFEVTSPVVDVTAYGYGGKHLEIRVPFDQPSEGLEAFTGCGDDQLLRSWIAPTLTFAFNGYSLSGDTEEFWILDVDGTRLVIASLTNVHASSELVAERQAILDSIVIVP